MPLPSDLATILDGLTDIGLILDFDGLIEHSNRRARAFSPLLRAGNTLAASTDAVGRLRSYLLRCADTNEITIGSLQLRNSAGAIVRLRAYGQRLDSEAGPLRPRLFIRGSLGADQRFALLNRQIRHLGEEIGRRQHAEALLQRALRDREDALEQFQLLFSASPYPVMLTDEETLAFIAVNDAMSDQYGWTRDEFLGMNAREIYPAHNLDALMAERRQVLPGITRLVRGLKHVKKDGTTIDVEMNARRIIVDGRTSFLTVVRDVTAQNEAVRLLRESEEEFRGLFESLPVGAAEVASDGTLIRGNVVFRRMYGLGDHEDLSGLSAAKFYSSSADRDEIVAALRPESPIFRGEGLARRHDGSMFSIERHLRGLFDADRNLVRVQSILIDISGRKLLESQLQHAQKMEVIGQLTGGVAHDFNNLLMVIMANVDSLLEEVHFDPVLRDRLKGISAATDRAAELTRQLLAFARKQPLRPEAIDVNDLVATTGKLLRRSLGEQIEIESLLTDDLWMAEVDRAQLESALVNLSINARDAMPGGGRLLIETANVTLDEDYAFRNDEVAAGEYVMLAVTDTGQGIPAGILGKVFEPFFTTKAVGKGSGLGLSMIYGFIKQSRGHIKIYSEVDRGTTVKLYLPRSAAGRQALDADVKPAVARGTERLLVVEDDELVRASVVGQLRSLGYDVTEAADGATALAAFESSSMPYGLLLTDVILPGGLNGRALADEVERRWPSTKVVFMSGYTENAIVHHGRLDADVLLLSKPFRKADLAKIMRQALD